MISPKTNSILIVTGSVLQYPALEAARALGLRVYVTDRDPDCALAEVADHFFPIDIYDVEGHVELAIYLAEHFNLYAVFTAAADPVWTVAKAAKAAGLHHAPLAAAAACSNKATMRGMLRDGEVPQPRWALAESYAIAKEKADAIAWSTMSGSVIIKATSGAGGRGHTKLHHPNEFTEEVFNTAKRHSSGSVLVEELLVGLELSTEAIWYDGKMMPLNAVERPFAHRPADLTRYTSLESFRPASSPEAGWEMALKIGDQYAIELGHYNPAMLSREEWGEVWEVVERCGHALGLRETQGGHVHKCDLIMTDDGVKVLETTLRLSGNWDSGLTSPLAHNVNYTMAAMIMAAGGQPDPGLLTPGWKRHAACLFKFAKPGTVKQIIERPHEGEVIRRYHEGDTVPPLDSYASLVAWVVADGVTRDEAVSKAYKALCGLEYKTEDGDGEEG